MWFAIVLALIAVAATALVASDKFADKKNKKAMAIGAAAIATAVVTQLAQVGEKRAKLNDLERAELRSADLKALVYSELFEIDEASGGALDPATGDAYLVDDEESDVFRLTYDDEAYAYRWQDVSSRC